MIVLVHQRLASKWYGPKCRGTDAVVPKDDCAREALRYCLSFLENHPHPVEIADAGKAILQNPILLKKLQRKIDLTIAPLLATVYFLQFLDKTPLSYTAVMGIRTNTHLKGQDYRTSEFSTQFLAQRIYRLGLYLGCVAPILVIIIEMWYKKEEQGRRIFGGCVAYGVSFAKTKFASWRISFLKIGVLTIVIEGLVFLPDSPVKAKRLSDAEKVAVLMRKSRVLETFKDIRIYLICLATLLSSIRNGGLSNFSSILLMTFGYSSRQALVLNTLSGAIGVVLLRDRSLVMLIYILLIILAAGPVIGRDPNGIPKNKAGLLAASFLLGTFGTAFMLSLAWNAFNIAGHSKKDTTNGLTLVSFAVGNILGTQTIIATLSALCLVVVLQNEKALTKIGEVEHKELRDKMAFADQTDRRNVSSSTLIE
ncbi:MFS general substrate transporter [Lepidopterella palustris CBS 459.81]|uniref:MFS general substrate transporter n=1 Tax=Lepidopterella palustris CBS 459.81 TaxID=1314670 RepID=A0A8E2JCG6_9PEZI|nr:MFS general substrate transporter [Lepidopterella palustris CBS 459.81]